jgi:hypothetical protein
MYSTLLLATLVQQIFRFSAPQTNSVETGGDTSKTKQLLETTENTLRKIVGKTRLDQVTNQDIRQ